VERIKIKYVSQRVEVDDTLPSPVGTVLVRILLDLIPNEDHVTILDAEQVE